MTTYQSVPLTVEAIQWTGGNTAEVTGFLGEDLVAWRDGRLWVMDDAGPFEVRPGYWLSRRPGESLVTTSPFAWKRHGFREDPR